MLAVDPSLVRLRQRLRLSVFCGAVLLGACQGPERTSSATSAADSGVQQENWAAVVRARRSESEPGAEMLRLLPLAGAWSVKVDSVGKAGELAPMAQGVAVLSSEFGGRFLRWRVELEVDREKVTSEGLLSFDKELGSYELLWISELSSAQRIARGHGDPERGGIFLETSVPDPRTGALRITRSVLKIQSREQFQLEQWGLDPESSEWILLQRTTYDRN